MIGIKTVVTAKADKLQANCRVAKELQNKKNMMQSQPH